MVALGAISSPLHCMYDPVTAAGIL